MSDLFGLNAVSPAPSAARPQRPFATPAIAAPTASAESDATLRREADPAPGPERPRPSLDPHPGPPPAFETNLLELDADLQTVIRQMQAAREQARDLHAIAPGTPSPTPGEPPMIGTESAALNPYD